jgi:glycosyltransferase involved in cell wall biosynthesis
MRICFITCEFAGINSKHGGLGTYSSNVTRELKSAGHDVFVIIASSHDCLPCWKEESNVIVVKSSRLPPINIHFYKTLRKTLQDLLTAYRIKRLVKKENAKRKFEILHSCDMYGLSILLGSLDIPRVCRTSFYMPAWRAAYGFNQNLSDRLEDWLAIKSMEYATVAISPSKKQADIFRMIENIDCRVVRSPINLSDNIEAQDGSESFGLNRPYVLFFGAVGRLKGFDLLSSILSRLFDQNGSLSLIICGPQVGLPDGRMPIEDLMNNASEEHKRRIDYLGIRSKGEIRELCKLASVVVFPSRIDNYPNACIEALAVGSLVVGSTNSSLEEIIEDGKSGLLFENGNSRDLLLAVNKALALPKPASDLIRKNARISAARASGESSIDDLISTYTEAIRIHDSNKNRIK